MAALDAKLRGWVEAGLISAEQAEAIRAAEGSAAPRGRISFFSEALGYIGGALFTMALFIGLSDVWNELGTGYKLAVLLAATAVLVASGYVLRDNDEPALERLGGFLWFAAAGTLAGAAFVFADDIFGLDDEPTVTIFVGVVTAAFATPLWLLRRKALQQIALFGGIASAVVATGFEIETNGDATLPGFLLAALGIAWLIGAQTGPVLPPRTGDALGASGALIGMEIVGFDEAGWLLLALLVAVGVMAVGVVRDRNVALGLGAAGLFVFVPQFITEAFGASLGATGAIAIAGLLITGIAVFLGRMRRSSPG